MNYITISKGLSSIRCAEEVTPKYKSVSKPYLQGNIQNRKTRKKQKLAYADNGKQTELPHMIIEEKSRKFHLQPPKG